MDLTNLIIILTNVFRPIVLVILALLISVYLNKKNTKIRGEFIFITVVLGSLLQLLIKQVVQKPRPIDSLIEVSGYSFPSGHASVATIFFLCLIYLFKDEIKDGLKRNLFIFSNIFLIVFISYTRLYLRVHYLSDVIAGILFGMIWVGLMIKLFNSKQIKSKITKI